MWHWSEEITTLAVIETLRQTGVDYTTEVMSSRMSACFAVPGRMPGAQCGVLDVSGRMYSS
jgi:hypothetical protein